jgi:hypothetical protein
MPPITFFTVGGWGAAAAYLLKTESLPFACGRFHFPEGEARKEHDMMVEIQEMEILVSIMVGHR